MDRLTQQVITELHAKKAAAKICCLLRELELQTGQMIQSVALVTTQRGGEAKKQSVCVRLASPVREWAFE